MFTAVLCYLHQQQQKEQTGSTSVYLKLSWKSRLLAREPVYSWLHFCNSVCNCQEVYMISPLLQIRRFFQPNNTDTFLISPWKHMVWFSLEAPPWGTSNDYPQHMFSWRNKKKITWIPPLIWNLNLPPKKLGWSDGVFQKHISINQPLSLKPITNWWIVWMKKCLGKTATPVWCGMDVINV